MNPPRTVAIATEEAIQVAAFREALRSFLRASERLAQKSGLTPQRHLLLLLVKGTPDGSETATITELALRMQLAQSTVTELVQRTVDAGLLARDRSESDGRVGHLSLTQEGERRLALVFETHDAEREKLRDMLNDVRRGRRTGHETVDRR
jgi:DNA-binding MarR family transcriptional regulator